MVLIVFAAASAASADAIVSTSVRSGDVFGAGPTLLNGSAVWTELSGKTVLLRSLDRSGHATTLFSTSDMPPLPQGSIPLVAASSIAAGEGRISFVRTVTRYLRRPCGPPLGEIPCPLAILPAPIPYAWTLYAGRPGSIRPVESAAGTCSSSWAPLAVGIADAGLVVEEQRPPCAPGSTAGRRIVLRSFSGRFKRVLFRQRGPSNIIDVGAAGPWATVMVLGKLGTSVRILRASSGRTVLRRTFEEANSITIDARGQYAIAVPANQGSCPGDRVLYGAIGRTPIHAVVSSGATLAVGVSNGTIAFAGSGPHCTGSRAWIIHPAGNRTLIRGLDPGYSLAYDDGLVTTASAMKIQLAAVS
jgi:hypothetical protein